MIGYSSLLGPIAGIMIVDYFIIRRCRLETAALYQAQGRYSYAKGWNLSAVAALCIGVAPNFPGFLHALGYAQNLPAFFVSLVSLRLVCRAFLAGLIYYL